jgi:precorrin-4 methylase
MIPPNEPSVSPRSRHPPFRTEEASHCSEGPGDPDLLTVKAHRLLSDENNLAIVDRLVSDEILGVIKGEIRRANNTRDVRSRYVMKLIWFRK